MDLRLHGGKYCGIKTIEGFHGTPHGLLGPVKAMNPNHYDIAPGTFALRAHDSFFTEEAPEESYLARLDRLLSFCKKIRPAGMIEVALDNTPMLHIGQGTGRYCGKKQTELWHDILIARGFVEVNSFINSNTGNTIHVYHLVYNEWDGKVRYAPDPREGDNDE